MAKKRGDWGLGGRFLGIGGAQASLRSEKGHLIGNQDSRRHQEPTRNKSGRARRMHRGWGMKNRMPLLGTRRRLLFRSRPVGGGGGREVEGDR